MTKKEMALELLSLNGVKNLLVSSLNSESTPSAISVDEAAACMADQMVLVFDEEELEAQLEFYRSPVGRRIGDKTPELTQATENALEEYVMSKVAENMASMLKQQPS